RLSGTRQRRSDGIGLAHRVRDTLANCRDHCERPVLGRHGHIRWSSVGSNRCSSSGGIARWPALLLPQYPFDSLHNWHFEILFFIAIIIQLVHIVLEAL